MRRPQRGFVLLLTLVLLQVIFMAGLLSLLELTLAFKRYSHFWLDREASRAANILLHDVENQVLMKLPACTLAAMPVADISAKPIAWWRRNSCVVKDNNGESYYVVEALGADDCALVKTDENHVTAADYYRITIISLPDKLKGARILLQSTLVKPAVNAQTCNDNAHYVKLGRQMIREI